MDTKQLKQKILDLAIRGKLVPQDPNDEPASVLLERIHKEKEQLIASCKLKKSKSKTSDTPHYENVPFEIPDSWEWVRLEDVAEIARGGSPRPIKSYLTENSNGINWIKIGDTEKGGKYINNCAQKIKPEGVRHSRFVHKGDFLLTNSMSFGRPYILNIDGCIHDGWLVISPIQGVYNIDFLYYILSSQYAYDQFSEQASGTAVSNLNIDKVENALFPIIPLEEQKRIVVELERWYDFIDSLECETNELQECIKQIKSKVLSLAIHGKLVPQDPNDEPAIELLKRINPSFKPCDTSHYENLPFEIPQNWVWVRIKDIAISELGKTLDKGKNSGELYDYLCALNVKWGAFDLTTIKQILLEDKEKERYLVRKGDLLICEGGDVGRAAIWENEKEIYYQNALHRVRFKGGIDQYFYLYALQYYKHLGFIDDVSGGVTIKHFTQNSMQKLLFPLPPLAEQKRIVKKIGKIFETIDKITAKL